MYQLICGKSRLRYEDTKFKNKSMGVDSHVTNIHTDKSLSVVGQESIRPTVFAYNRMMEHGRSQEGLGNHVPPNFQNI